MFITCHPLPTIGYVLLFLFPTSYCELGIVSSFLGYSDSPYLNITPGSMLYTLLATITLLF